MKKLLLFTSLILFFGCNDVSTSKKEHSNTNEFDGESSDQIIDEVEPLIYIDKNYLEDLDFDGDKISDYLSFQYTQGAHCCYKMSLKISSQLDTIHYPFEMDGGYGFGIINGEFHDQFDIGDFDQDGSPELFMGISTYNAEKSKIPAKWTAQYGITSNYIVFDYVDGKIVIEDYDKDKHRLNLKVSKEYISTSNFPDQDVISSRFIPDLKEKKFKLTNLNYDIGNYVYYDGSRDVDLVIESDSIRKYIFKRTEPKPENYYPDFVLIVFEFKTDAKAEQCYKQISTALGSNDDYQNGKAPHKVVVRKNEVYYFSTRAEMFRGYIDKFAEQLSNYP